MFLTAGYCVAALVAPSGSHDSVSMYFGPLYRWLIDSSARRPFVLTTAFLFGSMLILSMAFLLSGRFGRHLGESTTVRVGTEFTRAEANLIANSYSRFLTVAILGEIPEDFQHDELGIEDNSGLGAEALIANGLAELEDLVEAGDLQHIGLLGTGGSHLWSIDPDIEGSIKRDLFQQVVEGETISFLNRDSRFTDFDGDVVSLDLIESYVPFSLDSGDDAEVVLHLAKDVTDSLAANISVTESTVRKRALISVAALLSVLSTFVLILDLSIMRMSRAVVANERLNSRKLDAQNAELQ